MNFLIDPIKELKAFKEIDHAIKNKESPIYVHGVVRDIIGHFSYAIYEHFNRPMIIIVENDRRAKEVHEFLSEIVESACYFPKKEINYYNIKAIDDQISKLRIRALADIVLGKTDLIVTTFEALQRKISKKSIFKKKILIIQKDDIIDLESLVEKLIDLSFERVQTVEASGQFAIRGGIVDIFPISEKNPIRIELFGDEIDSMRAFDVRTQRSIEDCESVTIIPSGEFMLTEDMRKRVVHNLETEIERRVKHPLYEVDNEKTIEKFQKIQTEVSEHLTVEEDLIMPYLQRKDYDLLFQYFSKEPIFLFEDITRSYDYNKEHEKARLEDYTYLVEKGEVFEKHDKIYGGLSELLQAIREYQVINTSQLTRQTGLLRPDTVVALRTVESPKFNKQLNQMIDFLNRYTLKGYKIVVSNPGANLNNLKNTLLENKIPTIVSNDLNANLKAGQVLLTDQNLQTGFEYTDAKFIILTHREIYGQGKTRRKTKKKKTNQDIINYSDLNEGDYVVHENHGIGKYEGIEQIEVNHIIKDFLKISYRGNDTLYIPTDQMSLVQKYIGAGENHAPRISRLSGTDWKKTKSKAKKAIDEMAEDLVVLYAKRAKEKGYAFSKDTEWQSEFEEAFPYEETDSQIRAVEEIKEDMESDRPMDRLLCGDVGYGKTEVALRAAFKAIMDGKQVAILVPTTILCSQHYHTMVERFADFPITCEMLSRFRTPAKQKEIIKGIKAGTVDIVVGTHKLLSDSVKFRDIGLLIIDEEQRFGVRHKDKIKALKENLDVLILSATPIPRTLQMGLVGIRDMSLLDEPPENRSPVNTYVTEYNPIAIREAIEREVQRGGQVYFVYNRIDDILTMQVKLQELVPDIDIVVAHGRMSERELENIMNDFSDGEYDMLLCTTIIETGLDIQNVNTMIIYNADHMGLSQMYQLKGRVGRTDRVSYAYFTYPQNKVLTEVSEKRLMAIRDFTEFGSGFKIAMRDLELRGAGNILGESQSGHITSIGYDLYVKLLEDAIRQVKGEVQTKKKMDIVVDLKIDGFIPKDYIYDANEKIEMYQKIAAIENEVEYHEMVDELLDRFGDIPTPVLNIMNVSILKSILAKLDFAFIKGKKDQLLLEYNDQELLSMEDLSFIHQHFNDEMSFDLTENPKLIFDFKSKNLSKIVNVFFQLLDKRKSE